MRIYDGSPRQNWEEALRSVGAFADQEKLKELLFLELDAGFLLQGLGLQGAGADSDSFGSTAKRTYELTDDQIGEMMDAMEARRGSAVADRPHTDLMNYYEQALRIIGAYIDNQRAHDVFFFEQDGSFVLRLFGVAGSHGAGHQLSEFTKDEILAMIESAPDQRGKKASPACPGASRQVPMKAMKVLLISIAAILAAVIVIPLTILAGLFVWLKLTEESR